MKKIMLAAVAASFMSTGAQAVQLPAEGEACSSIHSNISVGINNPELSDYRKCVMIQHEIDTAFTYKTFWVRTGDTFTSFPVEELAKMTRSERIDYIKLSIQQGLLIETLEGELAASKERIQELTFELGMAIADNMAKDGRILELTEMLAQERNRVDEYTVVINEVEHLISSDSEFTIEVGATQAELDAAHAAGVAEGQANLAQAVADAIAEVPTVHTATVTAGFGRDNGEFFFVRFTHEVAGDVTLNITQTLRNAYNAGWADKREDAYSDALNDVKGDIIEQLALEGVTKASDVAAIITAVETKVFEGGVLPAVNAEDIINSAKARALEGASELTRGSSYDASVSPVTVDAAVSSVNDNDTTFTVIVDDRTLTVNVPLNASDISLIENAVNTGYIDGFEQGFKAGYDDGYNDGYNDGYADGFRAGVDSVTAE